ncbi:hypothetical protein AB1K83_06205 [Sporosarcina sp. 179-K 3D1 HS]|uniref:hypothetical protein n=1 Tax=Sporosarcina sp. 179-K 3D1 HS TaxID=3232169 RepID=UPI00399EF479
MKRELIFLVFCMSIMVLSACSSKPENVNQQFWEDSIQAILYIDDSVKKEELINTEVISSIGSDLPSLSDEEKEIINDVLDLSMSSIFYNIAIISEGDIEEAKKNYDKNYMQLEKTFGKSNLKSSNYNEAYIRGIIADRKAEEGAKNEEVKAEFMNKHKTNLTAKEVQYNMPNHLDEPFYLEGNVELCDYYNYGYKNEKAFFCGKLTPFDGGYTDSWYLYFHRASFEGIYNYLLEDSIDFRIIAKIPSKSYKDNQGNMAVVENTVGF